VECVAVKGERALNRAVPVTRALVSFQQQPEQRLDAQPGWLLRASNGSCLRAVEVRAGFAGCRWEADTPRSLLNRNR